jgi:hypothetical protein
MPFTTPQGDDTVNRLIELIEGNLFFLAKQVKTREQAIAIKERFQRPLGVLNSRFELSTNSATKNRLTRTRE